MTATATLPEELLTADEVAVRLKVTRHTVRRWAVAGKIPERRLSARCRRFCWREVVEALEKGTVTDGRG